MTALSKRRNGAFTRRRARNSRGAVAVEFALVLVPLVMLLIGTVTTGMSYAHAIGVTNAVREGARFGATADASLGSWTDDVITRTRATQFDDPSGETSICAQIWKIGAGTIGKDLTGALIGQPGTQKGCIGGVGGPPLYQPTATGFPQVPSSFTNGCVVRVLAARYFDINLVMAPSLHRTVLRGSVARYEGPGC